MSTIDQQARIELSLNAQKATDKLNELTKEAAKLNKELQETEKGTKQYEKLEKRLNSVEKNMQKARKAAFDVNKVLDNLSGASINDINKAIKEMTRQMNGMDRNSDKWKYYKEQIERAREELARINDEGKKSGSWLSEFDGKIRKVGVGIASAVAAFVGLTRKMEELSRKAMQKESSQANLKALTGLDDGAIAWLTGQAEQLSTAMEKSGLRVRQSSQEILDAYTLVGSAKPELLSNKEALNAVTIEAMRLAEAARMDLTQAVDAVTLSMNQYGASADEAARYTNVMAAGSKFGSAAVQSVTTAVKNAGVAASTAGIPIEALVGSIETLAEKGIKDEVAGTGLKNFFTKLEGMAEDVRPSVVGLQTALENLQAKGLTLPEASKMFGEEAAAVALTLVQSADKVKYYTEAVTGTNVAVEQAAINSRTAEARLAQARNKLSEVGNEIGQRLTPFVVASTKALTLMLNAVVGIIEGCTKYKTTLTLLVATIALLTAAKYKDIAASKLSVFWNERIVASLKTLFLIIRTNPYAALMAAVAAAIALFRDFNSSADEAASVIKGVNDVIKETNKNIETEKDRLGRLLAIARDETASKEARAGAIKMLNEMSPEYLGNLKLEEINTEKARKALERYMDVLVATENIKNATARKAELQEQLDALPEDERFMLTRGEALMKNFGRFWADNTNDAGGLGRFLIESSENPKLEAYKAEAAALMGGIKELDDFIRQNTEIIAKGMVPDNAENETAAVVRNKEYWEKKKEEAQARLDALDAAKKGSEEWKKYEAEIAAAQKNIDKYGNGQKSGDNRQQDKIDIIDARLEADKQSLKTRYDEGEMTYRQYLKEIKKLNEQAIEDKQKEYDKDSKEWAELEAEKTVITEKHKQDILKIEKKYEEDIQNFAAKYQEKSLEEKKQNELDTWDELYKEKAEKDELYHQIRNEIIRKYDKLAEEEKDKEKRKQEKEQKEQLAKLKENLNPNIYNLVDKGIIDDSKAGDINRYLDGKGDTGDDSSSGLLDSVIPSLKIYKDAKQQIKDLRNEEIISQEEEAAALAELWREHIEGILGDIAKAAEQAWSQVSAIMNAASELMQANMDLEIAKINQRYDVQLQRAEGNEEETKRLEEKKEAEIARVKNEYNKRQMKMQMAQLMATSAIGILNAWATAMKLENPILAPIYGGILSGIIVAQTAIQAAALKKQHEAQAAGYYSGGYTSRTLRDTDPAGVVHGNEFVVNARAVRNPAIRPMLDFIDTAQRNNYISSITSSDVARAAGAVPATTTVINNNSNSETLAQVVAVVAKLSKQLDQPIVARTYMTGPGSIKEMEKEYNKIIRNSKL